LCGMLDDSRRFPLSVRFPSKRRRAKFLIIYELEGYQKAVNYLTAHYGVNKMRVVLNGKKVIKGFLTNYFENTAYFTNKGLNRRSFALILSSSC
jgi:hypothetical protein